MPYVAPKDLARVRATAAVAELASSLEKTTLEPAQPAQTEPAQPSSGGGDEPPSEETTEATEAAESEPSDLASSRSHTPDAPSLLSCGTDSTNSVHTLSSVDGDAEAAGDDVEIVEPDDDVEIAHEDDDAVLYTPERAQYHRDIIAFTKPLYDRAKIIMERKLRVQRARGVVC
jgi:hypothetical protein